MKIKEIEIESIGPIDFLKLSFNDNFNIICGQNGVGKTTILNLIAETFSSSYSQVHKKFGYEKGKWNSVIKKDNVIIKKEFYNNTFEPNESTYSDGLIKEAKNVMYFKTYRDIPYQSINAINKDPKRSSSDYNMSLVNGINIVFFKNWFINRHMWSIHDDHLTRNQLKNLDLAKKMFSILDKKIKFKKIKPDSYDIIIEENSNEIYFEYLSSGYKSVLTIIFGIISEIEFRFINPDLFVSDFEGIIIIDELDLHVHPEWQSKLYHTLKEVFPKVQFIVTTHSPHLIQIANPNEIIALKFNTNNLIIQSVLEKQEYGYQGWTIEEILRDIMGMKDTMSTKYNEKLALFLEAIKKENYDEARKNYEIIDKMLHPLNTVRQILEMQMIGIR